MRKVSGPVLALSTDVEKGFSTPSIQKGAFLQAPQWEAEAEFQALGKVARDCVAQGRTGQLEQSRKQTAAS